MCMLFNKRKIGVVDPCLYHDRWVCLMLFHEGNKCFVRSIQKSAILFNICIYYYAEIVWYTDIENIRASINVKI